MPSRTIRDVIRDQNILTLPGKTTIRKAACDMTSRRVGSVMVVEGGQLVGIFTERDALVRVLAAGLDPETATLDQIMTADPTVIPVTASLSQALHVMHDGGFRHLPVVEGGKPVGMVSLRDAAGGEILAFERQLKDKAALEGILG